MTSQVMSAQHSVARSASAVSAGSSLPGGMIASMPIVVASLPGPIQLGLSVVVWRIKWIRRTCRPTREEVQREPAAEDDSGDRGKRLAELVDSLLEAEGERDDPAIIGKCR